MSEKIDLRVVKTRKSLKDAMMDLMREHKFEDIKVKHITEKALVNRATFYYHFKDKYDLLYKILDDELENIQKLRFDLKTQEDFKTKPLRAIYQMLKYFENNSTYYKNAFETEGYESLSVFFKKRIEQLLLMWVEMLSSEKPPFVDPQLLCSFYSAAFASLAVEWLKNDMREPPEYAAEQIRMIIEKGFFTCLNI